MPYPDDFKGTPYDNENDADREKVESLQQCYKDMLSGVIAACVKNRVCPSKDDVGALVQNVREFIGQVAFGEINEEIEVLDAKEEQDVERAYEAIVSTFRVKALDYSPFYRALAPTNPATLAATGKESAVTNHMEYKGRRIITNFDHPPIASRSNDWSAIFDDYDGAEDSQCPVGRGATEKEAVGDLIEKAEAA